MDNHLELGFVNQNLTPKILVGSCDWMFIEEKKSEINVAAECHLERLDDGL